MSLQLSVIIPVWNCFELTHNCLTSLRQHTPGNFMEVIVINNASSDATSTELEPLGRNLFGENFVLINNEQNLGFAKACNQGATKARAPMLFFLNNDTEILPHWLAPLLEAFRQESNLGACGPLLLYPDTNRVQHLGIAFSPTLGTEHLYANFPATHPVVARRRRLQAITGAAFMTPAPLFKEAGGFFEGYRNGCEDLELCCRLTDLGKTLSVQPQSQLIHLESQTPGRREHDAVNATLLNQRCHGAFGPDLHRQARRDGFDLALTPWLEMFVLLSPKAELEATSTYAPGCVQAADTKDSRAKLTSKIIGGSARDGNISAGAENEAASGYSLNLNTAEICPGLWWEGLQKEPLWQSGYELLSTFLENSGSFAEASGVRLLQAYFFPFVPHFKALARVAAKSGNPDLAQQAAEKTAHINTQLEDIDTLLNKKEKLAAWARQAGESELALLYENWL